MLICSPRNETICKAFPLILLFGVLIYIEHELCYDHYTLRSCKVSMTSSTQCIIIIIIILIWSLKFIWSTYHPRVQFFLFKDYARSLTTPLGLLGLRLGLGLWLACELGQLCYHCLIIRTKFNIENKYLLNNTK